MQVVFLYPLIQLQLRSNDNFGVSVKRNCLLLKWSLTLQKLKELA